MGSITLKGEADETFWGLQFVELSVTLWEPWEPWEPWDKIYQKGGKCGEWICKGKLRKHILTLSDDPRFAFEGNVLSTQPLHERTILSQLRVFFFFFFPDRRKKIQKLAVFRPANEKEKSRCFT